MESRAQGRVGSRSQAWTSVALALLAVVAVAWFVERSPDRPAGADRTSVAEPGDVAADVDLASGSDARGERTSARVVEAEAREGPGGAPQLPRTPQPSIAQFHGRIVADESGAPIAGARVAREGHAQTVFTDADGRFEWPLDANRSDELRIRAQGRALSVVRVEPGHADAQHALEVRLALGATIDARVRGDVAPAGLRLVVLAPSSALRDVVAPRSRDDTFVFDAPFDRDGRAWLADLPPRVALAVQASGEESRTPLGEVVLEPGETRVLDVDLGTDVRLVVRVVDQHGAPVRAARVILTQRPQTPPERGDACYVQFDDFRTAFLRVPTDDAGLAMLGRVPAGTWWLGLAKEEPDAANGDVAAFASRFEIADGVREHEITLRVDRGLYLRGRIVDARGAPVGRAYVGCERADLGGWVTGDVGDDGRFALGPVASGVHRVRVIPHGEHLAPEPQDAAADGPPLLFTLVRGGEIAGVVLDAATGDGARADWICSRSGGEVVSHGSLGDDGVLAIGGLATGTYAISARTTDGRAGFVDRIDVEAGGVRAGVRVELAPAARLRVRYSGGPERATCTVRVGGATVASGELVRGAVSEWFVPAGRAVVGLAHGDAPPTAREVDVAAGARVEVVVPLD